MDIPFYRKENRNDCGCAPVCLRMALAYFEKTKEMEEIYELCEALGNVHYTLPWGMCLGAAQEGLHAFFISKNPWELLPASRENVSALTGIDIEKIERIEKKQINRCKKNELIQMLKWQDKFVELPEKCVRGEQEAIVIPTVWWGQQPHNIVIVNYMDPGKELSWTIGPQGWKDVYYHDPNGEDTLPTMTEEEFFKKWLHANTDNDLLIISNSQLDLN